MSDCNAAGGASGTATHSIAKGNNGRGETDEGDNLPDASPSRIRMPDGGKCKDEESERGEREVDGRLQGQGRNR